MARILERAGTADIAWTEGDGPVEVASSSLLRSVAQSYRAFSRGESSVPLLKQTPIAVLFAVGVVLSFVVPSTAVVSPPLFAAGLLIVAIATVLSGFLSRTPGLAAYANIVPTLDILAVAVLRPATGMTSSIFSVIVILPVVWFAMNYGRRYIAYASAGVILAVLMPQIITGTWLANPSEMLRSLFSGAIYTIAAAVINEVARHARRRYELVKAREAAGVEDLSRGAAAQQALLPRGGTGVEGYDIAGVCLPSKAVGGDFYDWYPTADGLGFTLGDVMGKGVGAGIIAATARAVVRSARHDPDPVEAMTLADDCLSTELVDMNPFATMFHARLRARDGRLRYADAGHGLTLIARTDGTWERLSTGDLPLGLPFDSSWRSHQTFLGPGDILVSFSDGILDLFEGTLEALEQMAAMALRANSVQDVITQVSALAAPALRPDDVTVMAIRRSE